MTTTEYRDILSDMTLEQRQELRDSLSLGGKAEDIQGFVWLFEYHGPGIEPRIVQCLKRLVPGCDVKTEEEKVGHATITSANYARRGYNVSIWALIIAMLSVLLSLVALFK